MENKSKCDYCEETKAKLYRYMKYVPHKHIYRNVCEDCVTTGLIARLKYFGFVYSSTINQEMQNEKNEKNKIN